MSAKEQARWCTSAAAQIRWCREYILSRYGTPEFREAGWYEEGGSLPPPEADAP